MICKRLSEVTDAEFDRFLDRGAAVREVMGHVQNIINEVKEHGDTAVMQYTLEYDKADIVGLRVTEGELLSAYENASQDVIDALYHLSDNITSFHMRQVQSDLWLHEVAPGVIFGQKTTPLDRIGAYVPGGFALYPSTALMNIVPAKVAGVREVVVCIPPMPDGTVPVATLLAADIAGANAIYKIGGAQAIAAMAYGTQSVAKVDKIVGPGNVYVTAAKLLVQSEVEIDFPAGPSEIAVLADGGNPEYIAADIVAQLEHGPKSSGFVLTPSAELAREVKRELIAQREAAARKDLIDLSNTAVLVGDSVDACVSFINDLAPEHLELMVRDPIGVLGKIRNAGTICVGDYTPAAVGDYATGTSSTLPTGGFAKYVSGLNVDHFTKKTSVQVLSKDGLDSLADLVSSLAQIEGLPAHAASVLRRLQ
ncbi:MAG: histidinol dehydrogenase [Halobacteriota archaeon]|jgi:histidinol dehydrogenase